MKTVLKCKVTKITESLRDLPEICYLLFYSDSLLFCEDTRGKKTTFNVW